ncbi:MAG: hypothetical protein MRJ68_02795 [Nitrospira sp.]|nr:hypothetical protein [Nitrospira sp.]
MQKDRLATLTMDIVVNHPTKRTALDAVCSRLSPWAQAEWDRARNGVPITQRAARLGHSIREQRRCDESLIEHIFAALDGRICVVLDATYCFMTQRMLDRRTGRRLPPDAVRRFASQPIASLLLSARVHQDLKQRGVDTIGDLLPHAYEWLSPKRLAPGKPVMNVRLSVRRCLRILGVEIVFPEIRQRAIYCPCCAHTEKDVMKIVALAGV